MRISTRAEFEVESPTEEVFDLATACDGLSLFLFPLWPIPGVASAQIIDAPAPAAGARREVLMTDGAKIKEALLLYDRPSRQY